MKTKLLALIIAILCFVTAFAACEKKCEAHVDENKDAACDNCGAEMAAKNDEETEPKDDCAHADTDANKKCDVCGKAIVSIIEQIPAETEPVVDMIVNKAPADADISKYLNINMPENSKLTSVTKVEGMNGTMGKIVSAVTSDEQGVHTRKLIDIVTGKDIMSVTDVIAPGSETRYEIELEEAWYTVVAKEYTVTVLGDEVNNDLVKVTRTVYTYAGEQIGEAHVYDYVENVIDFVEPTYNYSVDPDKREYYVYYNGMAYAINKDSHKIVYSCNADVLVERPAIDVIDGDYGYAIKTDDERNVKGINVYDLTSWINCVYSFEAPEYAEYTSINVLNNGSILVSYSEPLSAKAVNYDYILGGKKYDVVYTLINTESFEEKTVEFGYVIVDVMDTDMLSVEAKEYNLVCAYEIAEGRRADAASIYLVDNDLNVVCDMTSVLDINYATNGVFYRNVRFNDGSSAKELIDASGKHIDYVPYESEFAYGYRLFRNRVYDLSNNIVVDFYDYNLGNGNGITFFKENGYAILSKEVETVETVTDPETGATNDIVTKKTEYSLFTAERGLEKLDSSADNWNCYYTGEFGYLVRYSKTETNAEGGTETKTYYNVYNNAGELLLSVDSYVDGHNGVTRVDAVDGAPIYIIHTENGENYIAK